MHFSICQLIICNLFIQHLSYLLWRDTTSELWTPVHSFYIWIQSTAIIYSLHFLQVTFIIHTIQLILCYQQAGEIGTLTVKLGQSSLIVLCAGSTLALESLVLRRATFCHQQLSEVFSSPTGPIKSWFDTEWKLAATLIIPSSWGLLTNVCFARIKTNFLAPLSGDQAFYKGSL